ncbi:MAG: serine hydrolase [Pseudomonadales bacterium]|nr:serine hydrolase [Pseudomonadales bacterium]
MKKFDKKSAGFDATRLERITDHINRMYIEPKKITGCQILVSRNGVDTYSRTFGLMDRERNKALREDTIFRIYSMSKPITSVALMMLYERGLFQLTDPVHRFIPSWKDQQVYVSGEGETLSSLQTRAPLSPITMAHILSHQSGLTYGATRHPVDQVYRKLKLTFNPDANETLSSFVEKLSQVPLRFDPGESWMYSFSTDVCGYLVEAISGKPFNQYLEEEIFRPLGMKDTSFDIKPEKIERFAANYERLPDKSLKLIDDPKDSTYFGDQKFFSGGGGLLSTSHDYALFCKMLLGGGALDGHRLLGSRTLKLMTMNHLREGKTLMDLAVGAFSETAYDGVGFGLGFASTLSQTERGVLGCGDFYWGGAASTIFWVDPIENMYVIFMTQLMPSTTFNFRGQLKNIIYSAITD